MPLPRPAPCCTNTLWPRAVSMRAPAGIMPTRYSRVFTSVGTPTIMGQFSVAEGPLNVMRVAAKSITRRVTTALTASGDGANIHGRNFDDAFAVAQVDAEAQHRHPFAFG